MRVLLSFVTIALVVAAGCAGTESGPPAGSGESARVVRVVDGDTLIVETRNFTDQTNFRGASENMHLTERFTRVSEDILLYEFTIDDPEAFTQPWTVQIPARRTEELMYEYACHEGNQSMIGILGGARAEERAAAEAASN